jgi:hypothetical protein
METNYDQDLAPGYYAPKVDWEKYADGQTWHLHRWVHFSQDPVNAIGTFRNWTARRGLKLRSRRVDATSIQVQVVK